MRDAFAPTLDPCPHERKERRPGPPRRRGEPPRSSRRSRCKQQAGEKRFSVVVQLLETKGGERLIRFAYTTDGAARRGPVTMRARDVERMRAALEKTPVLMEALGY